MKKLFVATIEYRRLEESFGEWLGVLGYAEQTAYNLPNLLREFFHYLEKRELYFLEELPVKVIREYFTYLRHRPHERHKGKLSQSHLDKHRQALKKFSEYLQQSQ